MLALFVGALVIDAAADQHCPPIVFSELEPEPGREYLYAFWRDGEIQDGALRIQALPARNDAVRVEYSFLLSSGVWTPVQHHRAIAAVVLRNEDELNGIADRQISVRPLHPPLMERSLEEGEAVHVPIVQTARSDSGGMVRDDGELVLSHAGCGTLIYEGEQVQTRRLRASYPSFVMRADGWRLVEGTFIYDIPIGANWFYSQHRESNHPMRQGTLMQGYTAP